jgi:Flp pilus assembly protein TadD
MKLANKMISIAVFQALLGASVAAMPLPGEQGKCLRGRVVSAVAVAYYRADALVMLRGETYGQQTNTKVGGVFSFCDVPPGNYALEATAPGYRLWRQPLSSGSGFGSDVTIVLEPVSPPMLSRNTSKSVSVKALQITPEAVKEHERFLQHAAKKDWEKSLASLERAVALSPYYFDAWNNMGIILSKMNRSSHAEAAFLKAIEIDPESSAARRNLGYFYLVRGRMKEAQVELERAAELNPRDARARAYLGHLLNETGKPEEAEKALMQALALEPEMPVALYQLGFVNLQLKRTQEALGWFERYLKQEISSPASDEVRAIVARLRQTPGI